MCGVVGAVGLSGQPLDPAGILRGAQALRHRGPDDEGYLFGSWGRGIAVEARGGRTVVPLRERLLSADLAASRITGGPTLALGHARLAILDPTAAGHQPMGTPEGNLWIVYNGEVYNFVELRDELAARGFAFRSGTDTEVVLAAYREWGERCVERFNGMWAFAIWDAKRRRLFASRDRFGVKPFYYHWDGERFAFASEAKGLLALGVPARIDAESLFDAAVLGLSDHTERTPFAGVLALPAGHSLLLEDADGPRIDRFYSLPLDGRWEPFGEERAAAHAGALRERLLESVRLRLRSDVPVGTCLSGGLDSSAIVGAVRELLETGAADPARDGRQRTFSAVYDDPSCDESPFIDEVVRRTGALARSVRPHAKDAWAEMARVVRHQEGPFGSGSIFAQWCVMRLAAEDGVKVLLDGQGGDELFAGYGGYAKIRLRELARAGRVGAFLRACREDASGKDGGFPRRLAEGIGGILAGPRKVVRGWRPLSRSFEPFESGFLAAHRGRPESWRAAREENRLQARLHADFVRFSLPQLLRFEDRNSMAFGVEARVPFLDYRIAEWAFALPIAYKIHDGWRKWVLRRAAAELCPEPVLRRRDKKGFPTPDLDWLEGGRSYLLDLLAGPAARSAPFVDLARLRRLLEDPGQRSTLRRRSSRVWRAITLEMWLREFGLP